MKLTDAIEQVVADLPAWVREQMATVVFTVEDHHPAGWRGQYAGTPLPHRTGGQPCPPSVITLYLDQFLDLTLEHVRRVVLHELGHHFGMTDRDLATVGA